MKVIFLDVDGVLNDDNSNSKTPDGWTGIDNSKVLILKEIVKRTNAIIVLTSSWKYEWERVYKDEQGVGATYLDKKLKRENLFIFDKTKDPVKNDKVLRGHGILNWLKNKSIDGWVVLDDEFFIDYVECGITKHLIKTNGSVSGLTNDMVQPAVNILNNVFVESNVCEKCNEQCPRKNGYFYFDEGSTCECKFGYPTNY